DILYMPYDKVGDITYMFCLTCVDVASCYKGAVPIGTTLDIINMDEDEISLKDILDRKSTRLNSSHLVISYAVFCLKKKTKYIMRRLPPYTSHTALPLACQNIYSQPGVGHSLSRNRPPVAQLYHLLHSIVDAISRVD